MAAPRSNAHTKIYRMKKFLPIAALLTFLPFLGTALAVSPDSEKEPVDFAREVMPVLSNKCFACHGPDTHKKGALRLDSHTEATRDLGGYQAINPSAPEKSEILSRLFDKDDPMPPSDAEKQLTSDEREILARWVKAGGAYADHWAFVPPLKQLPDGFDPAEREGVIDAFVASGLKKADVEFAPEADRATLARRVALVLTGLPPEPEELRAFLADNQPDAYERLVDKLMASPRYGEHQARYWLDAVRYGDTHGLHLDNRRGIYPYRDWVVRAFNQNLPLDDFITWQLAGDLLPDPTMEQLIATGYVRMNPSTAEGGAIPEEFQVKNNFDRTETFGTVFLGMTMSCARCHTHKYDPIPQTEYYRLLAFFNSTAESPLDGNSYEYKPILEVPKDQAAWAEWQGMEQRRKSLLDFASALVPDAAAEPSWSAGEWRISRPVAKNGPAPALVEQEKIEGFPGSIGVSLPTGDQVVWISFEIQTKEPERLWLTYATGEDSEVFVNGGKIENSLSKQTGGALLQLEEGNHTVRIKIAGIDEETSTAVWLEDTSPSATLAAKWKNGDPDRRLALLADSNAPLAHLRIHNDAEELSSRMTSARTNFTTTLIAKDLDEARPTYVLQRGEYDMASGDPLEPGILEVMSPFPEGSTRNRLGLARWLTSRDHPLVARVFINRFWQNVFGEGLVRTPEDFGRQGRQPTHPELLDWLAVELQESGWDLKHMVRLMVTSRTFRQSSAMRDEGSDPENRLWARGPGYRLDAEVLRDLGLWASGLLDPFMGGEGVKPYQPDGLWEELAHPASNTKNYERDKGRSLYRRSLYVYWKRTSPHPMMTMFDAPSREASCVRRSRTNTSLQSLGLLNETQRAEMARALAGRLLLAEEGNDQRLDLLFTLLACRLPTDQERNVCAQLLDTALARYADAESDAVALVSIGDFERNKELNVAEQAAWTQVASVVLASDLATTLY